MRTVSQIVLNSIQQSPLVSDMLVEGTINLSALARKMKGAIEKKMYKKVSEGSIVMALKRVSATIKKTSTHPLNTLKGVHDITVRSNLVELIVKNSSHLSILHREAMALAEKQPDAFINIIHGLYSSIIVASKHLATSLTRRIPKKDIISTFNTVASITIRLPEESISTAGVYYPILKILAWEGINFYEIISVYTEMTILFEEKDIERAFGLIKSLLNNE